MNALVLLAKERRALRHAAAFLALALAGLLAPAGGLVHGAAVVATGLALIRLAGVLLFRVVAPAAGVGAPRIVEDVSLVIAYVAWGFLRLRTAGMDVASLVTTSALITAVAAFAMQDTLGNVLGGLVLELDRSIRIGDWVRLDDLSGRVVQIRWRHTAIRTRNGEIAIVPNSALMKSRFLVIGNPQAEEVRWRRWIWFEVDFDVPAAKVIAAAEQALAGAEIANVAREPKPDCALMELTAGHARYALRYWLMDPQRDDGTDSKVRVHLLAAFERAAIPLSLPMQIMHQVKENQARRAELQARELETRMAALRAVELFAGLEPQELSALAGHLKPAPFAAGDVITRQGAVAHWLYLLIAGEVDVWLDAAEAPRRRVATLGPGTVFGEMGMMTGEPRRASVTARTDVQCYRLDKAGFEEILRARPAIAEGVSRVLAARTSGLRQALEQAHTDAAPRVHPDTLLARIRTFFGLDAGQAGPLRAV